MFSDRNIVVFACVFCLIGILNGAAIADPLDFDKQMKKEQYEDLGGGIDSVGSCEGATEVSTGEITFHYITSYSNGDAKGLYICDVTDGETSLMEEGFQNSFRYRFTRDDLDTIAYTEGFVYLVDGAAAAEPVTGNYYVEQSFSYTLTGYFSGVVIIYTAKFQAVDSGSPEYLYVTNKFEFSRDDVDIDCEYLEAFWFLDWDVVDTIDDGKRYTTSWSDVNNEGYGRLNSWAKVKYLDASNHDDYIYGHKTNVEVSDNNMKKKWGIFYYGFESHTHHDSNDDDDTSHDINIAGTWWSRKDDEQGSISPETQHYAIARFDVTGI